MDSRAQSLMIYINIITIFEIKSIIIGKNLQVFGVGVGNALVIVQNKVTVANLGLEFKSKGTLGPFSVVLQGNLPAQIVVGYLGTKTNEVGYTVRAPNGTIILTRTSGSTFKGGNVLSTFCPISNCLNLVTLTIR
jgi:hypothetical protein